MLYIMYLSMCICINLCIIYISICKYCKYTHYISLYTLVYVCWTLISVTILLYINYQEDCCFREKEGNKGDSRTKRSKKVIKSILNDIYTLEIKLKK